MNKGPAWLRGRQRQHRGPVCEALQEAHKKVIESEHQSGYSTRNYISISFKNLNQKAERPVVNKVIVTTSIDSHQYYPWMINKSLKMHIDAAASLGAEEAHVGDRNTRYEEN